MRTSDETLASAPIGTRNERMSDGRFRRRRCAVVGLGITLAVIAVVVGALSLTVGSPTIPAGAAATTIAVVGHPSAASIADPTGDTPYDRAPLVRRACLDPVVRPGGFLHLCWTVGRLMTENDPKRDEYVLRVVGTLHGEALPSGVRWAVIRARPDAASAPFEVEAAWPGSREFLGDCRDVPMALGLLGPEMDTVCGRTVGEADPSAPQSSGFAWTCAGCLVQMSGDRPVLLVVEVALDEGKTPTWDVSADLGS
jgi:hypothetical protein